MENQIETVMNSKKIFILLIVACQFLIGCNNIAAGSYPYAEVYDVDMPESELIQKIKDFKKVNADYKVPGEVGLVDGRHKNKDYWYHIYFYYKDKDQIIKAWTRRPVANGKTSFAFVAINQGLTLGNWKEINDDFSREENNEQKERFEHRILNRIIK